MTGEVAGGRGYSPLDARDFHGTGLERLRRAAADLVFLLDRGYPLRSAATFCANHYLLSERQRIALARWSASTAQVEFRQAREIPPDAVAGRELHVDGFNTIITLETGLCGSVLLLSRDGTVRDLAGLRGTYRLIPQTDEAIRLACEKTTELRLDSVVFWLDRPVSNSGRLAARMRDIWDRDAPALDIRVVPDVDRTLEKLPLVSTSDSVILDRSAGWLNLTRPILEGMGASLTSLAEDAPAMR